MLPVDGVRFVLRSLRSQPGRSLLTATGIGIGIAAVVLLTSLGEGVQRYVLGEFTQFGSNIIGITPGKTSTLGMSPGMFGTERPLTLDDVRAIAQLRDVRAVVPVLQGNAQVETFERRRRTDVIGVNANALALWQLSLASGQFLPAGELERARPLAVLGATIAAELFPRDSPLGAYLRIGGQRFRIVGVLAPKGTVLGFDLDRLVYVPAARAQALFNRDALMEVDVSFTANATTGQMVARLSALLERRHGRVDFTVITQAEMLEVVGRVLGVLTLAVGALGGISLLVGAVGIVTLLTIAVQERIPEIGLLKALGATRGSILRLFLGEALLLALGGSVLGLALAGILVLAIDLALPALPLQLSPLYASAALLLSALVGLLAGILPARTASALDPVEVLRAE